MFLQIHPQIHPQILRFTDSSTDSLIGNSDVERPVFFNSKDSQEDGKLSQRRRWISEKWGCGHTKDCAYFRQEMVIAIYKMNVLDDKAERQAFGYEFNSQ